MPRPPPHFYSAVYNSRSDTVPLHQADLSLLPNLVDALNSLTEGVVNLQKLDIKVQFDLNRYREHILARLGPDRISFGEIPPLDPDQRLDRIWRFVAIIFLTQSRQIDIFQDGETIWVRRNEVN